ncbi:MAG: sigma-70 family RNA polymerase sigma factor [Sphaerobacter sp.]|nr:sigma-70 family RNA polymerase sigma factor [Sphaerobacter sp.]
MIAAARRGDLAAFNGLVARYEREVFAVALRLLGDPHAAEDVTQETFLRAHGALEQFDGGSVRAWLLRIATNRSYDVLRYRRRRPAESLDARPVEEEPTWSSQTAAVDPEGFAVRQALSAHLEQALAELTADQRLAVLLHDVHGYPYEEIAQITGASLGTVKSRIHRGRARLRELLHGDERARELLGAISRQQSGDERA